MPPSLDDLLTRHEQPECDHGVAFDEAEWRRDMDLPRHDFRARWPRLHGKCPKGCGFEGIAYASFTHYLAGGW